MVVKAGVVFQSNFKNIISAITKISEDRMKEATNQYRNDLIDAMKNEVRTGISYPVPSAPRSKTASEVKNPTMYTASAPGEIPAVATGQLVKSLKTEIVKGNDLYGFVGSTSSHAPELEYGTFKIKPRPWFWPTFLKSKQALQNILSRKWF